MCLISSCIPIGPEFCCGSSHRKNNIFFFIIIILEAYIFLSYYKGN